MAVTDRTVPNCYEIPSVFVALAIKRAENKKRK